jgi:hypothetical protein
LKNKNEKKRAREINKSEKKSHEKKVKSMGV